MRTTQGKHQMCASGQLCPGCDQGIQNTRVEQLLLMSCVTGLQLLVLSEEVVKPLESGTFIEEVGH